MILFDRIIEEMGNVKRDWEESMKIRKMNIRGYVEHIKTNPQIYGELTGKQLSLLEAGVDYYEKSKLPVPIGFIGLSLRHKKATGHGQEEVDHEFKKLEKRLPAF